MDVKHSLSYFKQQEGWKKTYFTLVGLSLLNFIPMIGAVVFSIIQAGYYAVLTNHRIFKSQISLPEWDIKKIGISGLKVMAYSAWYIIIMLVFNVAVLAKDPSSAAGAMIPFFIFAIVAGALVDAALMVFATNLKFGSFFKLNAIKFVLINNFAEYAKFAIIRFFVLLLFGVLVAISTITIVGPLFLSPIALFALADLQAQFIRKIFKIHN